MFIIDPEGRVYCTKQIPISPILPAIPPSMEQIRIMGESKRPLKDTLVDAT